MTPQGGSSTGGGGAADEVGVDDPYVLALWLWESLALEEIGTEAWLQQMRRYLRLLEAAATRGNVDAMALLARDALVRERASREPPTEACRVGARSMLPPARAAALSARGRGHSLETTSSATSRQRLRTRSAPAISGRRWRSCCWASCTALAKACRVTKPRWAITVGSQRLTVVHSRGAAQPHGAGTLARAAWGARGRGRPGTGVIHACCRG